MIGRLAAGVASAALVWALAPSRAAVDRAPEVARVGIEDPGTYWHDAGFVEMTPPVRLPSREGKERIVVWLRVPAGENIRVDGRLERGYTLSYPEGTVADRVDLRDGDDGASAADVRGTRFIGRRELFHVLRQVDRGSARLSGVEWGRGDARAQREATSVMLDAMRTDVGPRELELFREQNDCAGCHRHDKLERTSRGEDVHGPPPNRATDASGLYVVETVLSDAAPLETHRARDMNADDPFVRVTCGPDGFPARLVEGPRGARHYACDDDRLPYARYDLQSARASGSGHAVAVCQSRSYLYEHMDASGRDAFAAAFRECGL